MSLKGTSFRLKTEDEIDKVVATIQKAFDDMEKITFKKVSAATDLVYQTARAKRPYISVAQAKKENRPMVNGKIYRVSDPNATAGVPVRFVGGGALQISIKKSVQSKGGKIIGTVSAGGGNVNYAGYMEFGTSKIAPRPFMRPAINLNRDAIAKLFSKK